MKSQKNNGIGLQADNVECVAQYDVIGMHIHFRISSFFSVAFFSRMR